MIFGDIYLDAENILRGKGNALDAPTIQALMAGFEDILSQESATVRQVRAYGKYRFSETAADGTTTKREGDPAVRRFVKFVKSATRFDVHIFDLDKFSQGPAARGEKVWVGVFRVPTGPNKAELRLVADFLHPKARVREPVLVLFGGGDQKHMLDRLTVEVDPVRSFFVIPNSAPGSLLQFEEDGRYARIPREHVSKADDVAGRGRDLVRKRREEKLVRPKRRRRRKSKAKAAPAPRATNDPAVIAELQRVLGLGPVELIDIARADPDREPGFASSHDGRVTLLRRLLAGLDAEAAAGVERLVSESPVFQPLLRPLLDARAGLADRDPETP